MKSIIFAAVVVAAIASAGTAHAAPAGPHSKVGDVDLPAGSTLTSYTGPDNSPHATKDETWKYTVSYDDAVAVLRPQLDGRYYTHGSLGKLTQCKQQSGVTDWLYSTDANSLIPWVIEIRVYRQNLIEILDGPADSGVCSPPMA